MQIEQSTLSNNRAAAGGAVYVQSNGNIATPLTVTGSTFSGNQATSSGGGAIYSDGTLIVTNSTFSGNGADGEGGEGGAILANVSSPFATTIRYSTFSDNRASSGGGIFGSSAATLSTSIVANSTGGDCANGVVDGGYNLIEDGSCIGQASSISGDPALLPLADNGGPTQTQTFIYGSSARNRIPQGTLECGLGIGADQRDEIRPTGGACDVGATEYVPAQPVAIDDNEATDEETALSVPVPGVLANDSDPNGDPLTVQLISGPSSGDVSLHADGAYVYTPTLNFNGADSFVYRIFDGNLSDSATVTIQVNPLNDPPMARPDQRYAASAGESIIDVLRNDTDVDGDALTLLSVSDPPKGTAVVSGNQILYTPDPGPVGSVDTFTYTMTDGQEEASAQVTVTTFQADLSGACTTAEDLIAAIDNANLDADEDTITLAAGCSYTLTTYAVFNPDGYGPVGLPPIDTPIVIVGNGALIERDGSAGDTFRLFYVREEGDLTLNNIHLRGGVAQGGNGSKSRGIGDEGRGGRGGGAAGLGGAIFNRGDLSLQGITISDSQAIGGNGDGVIGGSRHQGGGGGGMAASATNRNGGAGGGGNGGTTTNGSNGGFGGGGGGGGYSGTNGRNGGNGGFGGGGGGASGYDGGTSGNGGSGGYGGGSGRTVSAGGGAGMGGAIFNWHGSVSLVNSTLTGNRAQGGAGVQDGRGLGGALFNGAGTVEIVHSTLAGNIVQGRNPAGGGVFNYQPNGQNAGIITLRNSILADSSGGNDCGNDGGTVTAPSPNHNLIEVVGACAAPATTADPALSALADNGGGTPTLAIASNSPAKDAIPVGDCLAATDQRGVTRPQHAACDIGAYEFVAAQCWVERTGDETPDHVSVDAAAVQEAIDAAPPDSLLKIAGICAGVQATNGMTQTVYIDKDLTLRGGYTTTNWLATPDLDANPTILDAQGLNRVVFITGTAKVTVENLALVQGDTSGNTYPAHNGSNAYEVETGRLVAREGTAFFVGEDASLHLLSSQVHSHTYYSSGLANLGTTTISDTLFAGNQTRRAVYNLFSGHMTVDNSTFRDNSGDIGTAIANEGVLTLTASSLISNTSGNAGGHIGNLTDSDYFVLLGIDVPAPGKMVIRDTNFISGTATNNGGAIYNQGEVHISGSHFEGNSATKSGGAIYNTDGVDANPTFIITSTTFYSNTAGTTGGVLRQRYGQSTFTDSTFLYNSAGTSGGVVRVQRGSVTINGGVLSHNSAVQHGGALENSGTLNLDGVTISYNRAIQASRGGGVESGDGGALTIANSTIAFNDGYYGSGVAVDGATSTAILTNTTISGNSGDEGAIYSTGQLTLTHVTVLNSSTDAGASVNAVGGSLSMEGSIVGNPAGGAPACSAPSFTDLGYNLVEDGSCITAGTSQSGDPLLGALADNGGGTETHALLAHSPALDAIPSANCGVAEDQRGVSRPQGSACDIGAYELNIAELNVTATLEGRTDHTALHTLSFYTQADATLAFTVTGTADAVGAFVLADLVVGTYSVTIQTDGYLQAVQGVTLTAGQTGDVDFGELVAGDANGDNVVNILDLSLFSAAYGTSEGDAAYNAVVDLNGDGAVNILDLSLLSARFTQTGEEP